MNSVCVAVPREMSLKMTRSLKACRRFNLLLTRGRGVNPFYSAAGSELGVSSCSVPHSDLAKFALIFSGTKA